MPAEKLSVVDDGGEYSSRCGYCNGRNSSRCHGMTAVTLTPADYQRLIDRSVCGGGNRLALRFFIFSLHCRRLPSATQGSE